MRLLVAESDPALSTFLQHGFVSENYDVELAGDADAASSLLEQHDYDLAILDLTLPHPEEYTVLRQTRAKHLRLPIVMVISLCRSRDGIRVLEMGADDFVIKPFEYLELSARVRALLRRCSQFRDAVLSVEDLELNRAEHKVRRANCSIELTPREFSLLEFLMHNAGHPVSRQEIIEHVWNSSCNTVTNLVDVYINYIRKKVDAPSEHKLIRTVRGIGYQLEGNAGRLNECQRPLQH